MTLNGSIDVVFTNGPPYTHTGNYQYCLGNGSVLHNLRIMPLGHAVWNQPTMLGPSTGGWFIHYSVCWIAMSPNTEVGTFHDRRGQYCIAGKFGEDFNLAVW